MRVGRGRKIAMALAGLALALGLWHSQPDRG